MDKLIKIFPTPFDLAKEFADSFISMIESSVKNKKQLMVALSGGSTPDLLFSILGDHFSKAVPWEFVHFFWGDERCVNPDDPESNFGMTWNRLLSKIDIPSGNIHRIKGENEPEKEAIRYSKEISETTLSVGGLPFFDIILLGLGEDGHTASIFPENIELLNTNKICDVSVHPHTMQKRITITGNVINNAGNIYFLVTGRKKAIIVEQIINKRAISLNYPAAHIIPSNGILTWFIDKEAGILI